MRIGKKMVARQWYRSALPEQVDVHNFLEPTLASFQAGACFCLASAFQAFQRGCFRLDEPIRQRAVVLWGTADRTHAETQRTSILEHVPRATFLEDQRCGHFPDLENPQAYVPLLRALANGEPLPV